MALANSSSTYGSLSRGLHWLTALLIVLLIPLGIIANGLAFENTEQLARKAMLFSLHKTLGVVLFFVALIRITWMITQPKPRPLHPERRLETLAAETVHWTLYTALLAVPLSGWIHHAAATGFAPIWWPLGQSLPFVPKSETVAHTFASLHIIFERVLVIALALHVAGALKHQFVDRDRTLARMTIGAAASAPADNTAQDHGQAIPVLGAAAAYAAALGVGASLGLFTHDQTAPTEQPALAEVVTEWSVESGNLSFEVAQLGQPVTGSFEDWTAAIRYDPETRTGDVTVTIAIPSLTLGSVTGQALGAEFFDATAHPTAIFAADIRHGETGGHVAEGTLRLKGAEIPVQLPFELTLTEGQAVMTGQTVLDRLSFGIGPSYPDGSQVGLEVTLNTELVATRSGE